jgi:hypothetical protein
MEQAIKAPLKAIDMDNRMLIIQQLLVKTILKVSRAEKIALNMLMIYFEKRRIYRTIKKFKASFRPHEAIYWYNSLIVCLSFVVFIKRTSFQIKS